MNRSNILAKIQQLEDAHMDNGTDYRKDSQWQKLQAQLSALG
jgi:hypothetical protein